MYKFNESKNLQWAELIFCLSSGRLVVVALSKNPLSARCIKTNLTLQDTVWMPNNFWLCIPKMAAFPELGRQFLVFVLLSALIAPFTNSWHQTFSLFYHFFFCVQTPTTTSQFWLDLLSCCSQLKGIYVCSPFGNSLFVLFQHHMNAEE